MTAGSISFTLGNGTGGAQTNHASTSPATVTSVTPRGPWPTSSVKSTVRPGRPASPPRSTRNNQLVLTQSQGDNISFTGLRALPWRTASLTAERTTARAGVGRQRDRDDPGPGDGAVDAELRASANATDIGLAVTTSSLSALSSVNVSTQAGATAALNVVNFALQQLENVGGQLGAIQQRLQATVVEPADDQHQPHGRAGRGPGCQHPAGDHAADAAGNPAAGRRLGPGAVKHVAAVVPEAAAVVGSSALTPAGSPPPGMCPGTGLPQRVRELIDGHGQRSPELEPDHLADPAGERGISGCRRRPCRPRKSRSRRRSPRWARFRARFPDCNRRCRASPTCRSLAQRTVTVSPSGAVQASADQRGGARYLQPHRDSSCRRRKR